MINIVLYEPEIPENTGNIMRTCAATNSKLHLIEPFGFIFDENRIKRCGANYIDKVNYERYVDFDEFLSRNSGDFYYFRPFFRIVCISFFCSCNWVTFIYIYHCSSQ